MLSSFDSQIDPESHLFLSGTPRVETRMAEMSYVGLLDSSGLRLRFRKFMVKVSEPGFEVLLNS